MTRTGARAKTLERLLTAAGLPPAALPPRPRLAEIPDPFVTRIKEVYLRLGGAPEHLDRARPGAFDLAVATDSGPLVIELDEEQHFNRYRVATLSFPWADALPWVHAYRDYSRVHEANLARTFVSGRRWTNDSAPRFFGPASAPGDFTGVGSPRWRQRAFYDAVKDLMPGVRLARIAVFDNVDRRSLNAILRAQDMSAADDVRVLIEDRTHSWTTH